MYVRHCVSLLLCLTFVVIAMHSLWVETDYSFNNVDVYTTLDSLTYSLGENSISYFLAAGSALGAARRGAVLKGDKDVDIYVVAYPEEVETALWGFDWSYTDFGYHVHLKKTNFYFDIWLMQESDGMLKCVGAKGKCHLWEEKFDWKVEVPVGLVFPVKKHAFGGYLFNFPNDIHAYLTYEYPDWQTKCGGWHFGTRPCTRDDFK